MTLPWGLAAAILLLLAVAFGNFILGPYLAQRRLRKQSLSWPMVPAEVSGGGIQSEVRDTPDVGAVTVHILTASYRYRVGGLTHLGVYREEFSNLTEAEQVDRSLRNGPLFIRYNPQSEGESFLDPYRDVRMEA